MGCLFNYRPGVPSVIAVAKAATCQSRVPPVALCVSKPSVTVDCTRPPGSMGDGSSMANFYELLNVPPTASDDDIKHAYRHMAKKFHPDKNDRLDAKTIFQKLNNAYCTLTDTKLRSEYDAGLGIVSLITESDDKDCSSSAISMTIKENRSSVTIDIEDIMFLPLLKQCEIHHSTKPVDNGPNGLQFKFAYTSPNDIVPYGTISLTFYPSTSRLLVQGTSYLLWVEEYRPLIYNQAHVELESDTSKWYMLARKQGVGRNRASRAASTSSSRGSSSRSASTSLGSSSRSARGLPGGLVGEHGSTPSIACHEETAPSSSCDVIVPMEHNDNHLESSSQGSSCDDMATSGATGVATDSPAALEAPVTRSQSRPDTSVPVLLETDPINNAKKSKTQNRDKMNKKRKISSAPKKKKAKHKRSSDEEPNDAVQVQHCSIDCRYDRKDSSAMIRCSLCMAWHHLVCVGEDDGYMGVWTCMQCRNLPVTIATLQTQMQQLVDSIAQVKSTNDHSQDEIRHLKSENGKLRVQNEQLSHQNSDLKKLIETMSDSNIATSPCSDVTANISYATVSTSNRFTVLSDEARAIEPSLAHRTSDHVRPRSENTKSRPAMPSKGPSPAPAAPVSQHRGNGDRTQRSRRPQRKRVTIIGSSLVRGLGPLVNCEQFEAMSYTHPGATAELLLSRVEGMTKGSNSDVIVVAGGTNNISEHSSSQCIQAIRKLVDSVAEINPRSKIIISEIPHRFDNAKLNPKVDSVNGYIRRLCNSNRRYHSLSHDYDINDYTADGLHLNDSGKAKYAHEIRHVTRELLYGNNV